MRNTKERRMVILMISYRFAWNGYADLLAVAKQIAIIRRSLKPFPRRKVRVLIVSSRRSWPVVMRYKPWRGALLWMCYLATR